MNFPQKESPAGGQGFDHVGSGDQGTVYTEQASKARVAKPIPVVLVMTKATPKGSVVTVPGKIGGVSFGEVGQVLVEFVKLHFARQAARMGYQRDQSPAYVSALVTARSCCAGQLLKAGHVNEATSSHLVRFQFAAMHHAVNCWDG